LSRKKTIGLVTAGTLTLAGAAIYALGRKYSGPRYAGPESDHFDGKKFRNKGSAPHGFASFLKWVTTRRERGEWPTWIDSTPGKKPPARVEGATARVTFINHATVLIQIAGLNILTDPIWSDRASPLQFAGPKRHRAPGIEFDDLPQIDVVIISHNHYDHIDIETLNRLDVAHHPVFFTPLGNSELLEEIGIEQTNDLDWWESVELSPALKLTCVPAQHFSGRGTADRDATLWCGWVLTSASGSIYFAGDTGYGEHFTEIAERFSPIRVALLPIGAFLPLWFMGPVHISPREAVRAHKALRAQRSMPIHFGTFALGDDGLNDPLNELEMARRDAGVSEEEFFVLKEGEGREI
jgi:L-ascorbate metabolism protein UlaG (beta-lactamase superfamily)